MKNKIMLTLMLLLPAGQISAFGWDDFTHAVSSVTHSISHAVTHPTEIINSLTNNLKAMTNSIAGFVGEYNPVAITEDVIKEKKAIKKLEEKAPDLLGKIKHNIDTIEGLISNKNTQGNLKVLQEVKSLKVPTFPAEFSASNFNADSIQDFMKAITDAHKEVQRSIDALFNLMTISFQGFAVLSQTSMHTGKLSGYIGDALTPLPLETPRAAGKAFKDVANEFATQLPSAFKYMHSSVDNFKSGITNVNQNFGQALHMLQEKALMLQHMLSLIEFLGGSSKGSVAPPPPPPPPAPPAPMAANTPRQVGPPSDPTGDPVLPPPPPPVS